MSDPRKFKLSSDYPMDKIVWLSEGSLSVDSGSFNTPVAHGLPFTPLIMGSWSFAPDFSLSRDFALLSYASPSANQVSLRTDPTNLLFGGLFADSTSHVIYYRLYAFAPPDYTGKVTPPVFNSGFRINSDLNYVKLLKDDVAVISGTTPVIFEHNLGYRPMVLAWGLTATGVSKITSDSFDSISGQMVNVTDTQLIMRDAGNTGLQKIYYRVYLDD